jgi:putative endonuclease
MVLKKIEKSSKQNNQWVLYILECGDQSLYTGITNRLAIRIEAHQKGIGARYTRGRLPLKVVYTEECSNRSDASKRECAVKKLSKSKKIELIKTMVM